MPEPLVRRLDLKVGFSCSNDCLFCVVADKRSLTDKMTFEIERELSDSYDEGKREVVFTGGEVTIRKDVLHLVRYARRLGFREIQIQTNGRRFSCQDFTKKMQRAGMNTLAPSIHGSTARTHDGLTRSPGSWRQTIIGIHHAKRIGLKIMTNTVITKQNYRQLPQIGKLLTRLKVNQFQFAFVHIMGNAEKFWRRVVPRLSNTVDYIKKGLDIGIRARIPVMVEAVPLCHLENYEQYASEFFIPPTQVKSLDHTIENFHDVRRNHAKKKFGLCARCKWETSCEGPWKEYPALFGTKEFAPVLD